MHTKLGRASAVLALTAVLAAGNAALAQDERVLTVEQTAIQAVQAPPPASAANPLDVVAWVDHATNTYAQGEQVRVFVQTNKDAYVTVLNVGPDGSTTVLFPNQYQTDNRVRANTVTEVPDPASRARIAVSGTTGAELLKVVATSRPTPLFEAAQLAQAGVFQTIRQRAQETARNLAVVMAEAETTVEWDVYDKVIRTVPQRPAAAAPAALAPVAGAGWPSAPFGLELAADKPVYRVTDPVTLMVKARGRLPPDAAQHGPRRRVAPAVSEPLPAADADPGGSDGGGAGDRGRGLRRADRAGGGGACDGHLPDGRGTGDRRARRLPGRRVRDVRRCRRDGAEPGRDRGPGGGADRHRLGELRRRAVVRGRGGAWP